MEKVKQWCPGAESNHRHEDFQSSALPKWQRIQVKSSETNSHFLIQLITPYPIKLYVKRIASAT